MTLGRRELIVAGLGAGIGAGLTGAAGPRSAVARESATPQAFSTYGVVPAGGTIDQTATLQEAADEAARTGVPLFLPAGTYSTGRLSLKSGTQIEGVPGLTILRYAGGGAILGTESTDNVRYAGLVLDGGGTALGDDGALLIATEATHFDVSDCRVIGSSENGIVLRRVAGRIVNCEIGNIAKAALFSEDARGLEIAHNHVRDCGDNGILVWRSDLGEDGTIVTGNRIERIAARSGGSGQNGNGINIFRAGSVLVNANRIADCAFSAIRSNSGSNCQMVANSCARLGEVALYAEYTFEGAIIANNIVDAAAMGVSVTNFNEGGRLAVVQGNIIRNLFLRKDADSRGIGIGVEADSVVSNNVIEGAPAYGILVGWGDYLRDVSVTDNVIRKSHIGIGVSVSPSAGTALITDNLITGAKDGAIRAMDGPKAIGPDLATQSAEAYGNLAVYANVAR
ncbi:MAG TPA: TIGR03808 family TAT-translocated repetitive protein [Methyloceanibacter sp.]|nr:TIGR03808 family TAT-translocated repetitive protein [Methyloceanibacter sp.]